MELKQYMSIGNTCYPRVLIVPFMELKLIIHVTTIFATWGLNRTFYGIETVSLPFIKLSTTVLIVPFMELKHVAVPCLKAVEVS